MLAERRIRMDELAICDATKLVKKMSNKEVSSSELLEYYSDRIERCNSEFKAVVVGNSSRPGDHWMVYPICWQFALSISR